MIWKSENVDKKLKNSSANMLVYIFSVHGRDLYKCIYKNMIIANTYYT